MQTSSLLYSQDRQRFFRNNKWFDVVLSIAVRCTLLLLLLPFRGNIASLALSVFQSIPPPTTCCPAATNYRRLSVKIYSSCAIYSPGPKHTFIVASLETCPSISPSRLSFPAFHTVPLRRTGALSGADPAPLVFRRSTTFNDIPTHNRMRAVSQSPHLKRHSETLLEDDILQSWRCHSKRLVPRFAQPAIYRHNSRRCMSPRPSEQASGLSSIAAEGW